MLITLSYRFADPFIRSMTYWLCRKYRQSSETLLLNPATETEEEPKFNEMAFMGHPDIFNFYFYLRSHPYVRRCHLSKHALVKEQRNIVSRKPGGKAEKPDAGINITVFTPMERELLFRTAHTHLDSGMPSLALEVLLLLPKPKKSSTSGDNAESSAAEEKRRESASFNEDSQNEDMIVTGTFSDEAFGGNKKSGTKTEVVDWSKPVSKAEDFDWSKPVKKAEDFDWSKPVSKAEDFDWSKPVSKAEDFDWSKPVANKAEDFDWSKPVANKAEDFDWSKPVNKAEDFDWSKPVSSEPEFLERNEPTSLKIEENSTYSEDDVDGLETGNKNDLHDVAALQIKYVTIFKCLIEELRSLPSTCTIEGVKLRPTVAHLLERELEVLHSLSDYEKSEGTVPERLFENLALHEALPRKDSDRE